MVQKKWGSAPPRRSPRFLKPEFLHDDSFWSDKRKGEEIDETSGGLRRSARLRLSVIKTQKDKEKEISEPTGGGGGGGGNLFAGKKVDKRDDDDDDDDGRSEKKQKQKQKQQQQQRHHQPQHQQIGCGWTKEQELALQIAFFAAKPTPHFWNKVARMVPGKSAQECFDKVHSDPLTPPQAQPRSRAKRTTPSPLSFSASKLLNSTGRKSKKHRYSRHNSRLAQKTLRHLLQKQYNVDREEENDLFGLLEATVDPSTGASQHCTMYSTPEHKKGGVSFLTRRSKQFSPLSTSCGASLISPPVLKQIKNKALHEKYIDQLHSREAKRKAALVRAAKQVKSRTSEREESHVAKLNALRAAKSALFLDARDAINQFQDMHARAAENCDLYDDDDDVQNSEYDGSEGGP